MQPYVGKGCYDKRAAHKYARWLFCVGSQLYLDGPSAPMRVGSLESFRVADAYALYFLALFYFRLQVVVLRVLTAMHILTQHPIRVSLSKGLLCMFMIPMGMQLQSRQFTEQISLVPFDYSLLTVAITPVPSLIR
jgi:hypothetical protein